MFLPRVKKENVLSFYKENSMIKCKDNMNAAYSNYQNSNWLKNKMC